MSSFDQYLSKQGYAVEKIAKKFLKQKLITDYPKGSTINFQKNISNENYEARLDAVILNSKTNKYDIFEIKSKTKVEKEDKYDITFQYLIAKDKLNINNVYVIHINGEYIKQGDINLTKLFIAEDMAEVIEEFSIDVYEKRGDAISMLKTKTAPLDEHCFNPSTCPSKKLCHPKLSKYPIYDLPYGNKTKYKKLLEMNIHSMKDIPSTFELNPRQKQAVQTAYRQKPVIKTKEIKKELGKLEYPLYFLDYETFPPAIPIHDNYAPYQQIVFQYSLHVINNVGDDPEHYEFLSTRNEDPSEELVLSLRENIGDTGSIIVWHKDFECSRNKELAKLAPKHSVFIEDLNKRVFDLKEIFSNALYSDYRFHGSASIKSVLPILVPKLSYKDMDIGEGTAAMTKWHEMVYDHSDTDAKFIKIKNNLLAYCKLDTLAMVEIWRVLEKLV